VTRLSRWFLFLFVLTSFLTLVFERILPWVASAGALIVFWFWSSTRKLPISRPLLGGVAGLLVMASFSIWVTPLPHVTVPQALRLLVGVELCLCLALGLDDRKALDWTLGGLLSISVALGAAALLFTNWADKFHFLPSLSTLLPPLPTELDTAIHPNVIGGFLALLLGGLLAWFLFRWSSLAWLSRIALLLASLFIAGVLLLSQSRTSLLALAGALLLLVVLRWRWGWAAALLGLAAGLGMLYFIGPEKVFYSLGGATGGTGTLAARADIWLRARLLIADFPLTGAGMGAFGEVVDRFYPLAIEPLNIPHAHNLFLQLAADLGLPGLLAWLVAWFSVLWMAFRLYRRGAPFNRALGAAVLCTQTALFIHGLLDCVTWGTRPALLVWAIWGLAAAAYSQFRLAQPTADSAIRENRAGPELSIT